MLGAMLEASALYRMMVSAEEEEIVHKACDVRCCSCVPLLLHRMQSRQPKAFEWSNMEYDLDEIRMPGTIQP